MYTCSDWTRSPLQSLNFEPQSLAPQVPRQQRQGVIDGKCRVLSNSTSLYHHDPRIIWLRLPPLSRRIHCGSFSCIMLDLSPPRKLERFRSRRTGYINGPIDMHRLPNEAQLERGTSYVLPSLGPEVVSLNRKALECSHTAYCHFL